MARLRLKDAFIVWPLAVVLLAEGCSGDAEEGPPAAWKEGLLERVETELVGWGFDPADARKAAEEAIAGAQTEVHDQIIVRFATEKLQNNRAPAKDVTEYMLEFAEKRYDDELAPELVAFFEEKLAANTFSEDMKKRVQATLAATREKMKPLLLEHLRVQADAEQRLEEADSEEEKEAIREDQNALQQALVASYAKVTEATEVLDGLLPAAERLKNQLLRTGTEWTSTDKAILERQAREKAHKERKRQEADRAEIEAGPIPFAPASTEIASAADALIGRAADFAKAHPKLTLEIHGHADAVGSTGRNERLSRLRAERVADALIEKGVAKTRLRTESFGESLPRADNATSVGRAQNRRVEITFEGELAEAGTEDAVLRAQDETTSDESDVPGQPRNSEDDATAETKTQATTPGSPAGGEPATAPPRTTRPGTAEAPDEAGGRRTDGLAESGTTQTTQTPESDTAAPTAGGAPDRPAGTTETARAASESQSGNEVAARRAASDDTRGPAAARPPKPDYLRSRIKPWLRTPYKFGCKDRSLGGIDCSGFVHGLFLDAFKMDLPDSSQLQSRGGVPVKRKNLRPGDLVFFDVPGKGRITHVAVYVGKGEIAHATSSKGVKYDKLPGHRYWGPRYRWARRYIR